MRMFVCLNLLLVKFSIEKKSDNACVCLQSSMLVHSSSRKMFVMFGFFLCVYVHAHLPEWFIIMKKMCWFICVLRVSKVGCVPTSEFQVEDKRRPRSYFAIFVHQHMHRGGSFALKGFGLQQKMTYTYTHACIQHLRAFPWMLVSVDQAYNSKTGFGAWNTHAALFKETHTKCFSRNARTHTYAHIRTCSKIMKCTC